MGEEKYLQYTLLKAFLQVSTRNQYIADIANNIMFGAIDPSSSLAKLAKQ